MGSTPIFYTPTADAGPDQTVNDGASVNLGLGAGTYPPASATPADLRLVAGLRPGRDPHRRHHRHSELHRTRHRRPTTSSA